MATVKLTTPVDEATIRSLHVGDTVSIGLAKGLFSGYRCAALTRG